MYSYYFGVRLPLFTANDLDYNLEEVYLLFNLGRDVVSQMGKDPPSDEGVNEAGVFLPQPHYSDVSLVEVVRKYPLTPKNGTAVLRMASVQVGGRGVSLLLSRQDIIVDPVNKSVIPVERYVEPHFLSVLHTACSIANITYALACPPFSFMPSISNIMSSPKNDCTSLYWKKGGHQLWTLVHSNLRMRPLASMDFTSSLGCNKNSVSLGGGGCECIKWSFNSTSIPISAAYNTSSTIRHTRNISSNKVNTPCTRDCTISPDILATSDPKKLRHCSFSWKMKSNMAKSRNVLFITYCFFVLYHGLFT